MPLSQTMARRIWSATDIAVMDLADKVADDATAIRQADIDQLRCAGLSQTPKSSTSCLPRPPAAFSARRSTLLASSRTPNTVTSIPRCEPPSRLDVRSPSRARGGSAQSGELSLVGDVVRALDRVYDADPQLVAVGTLPAAERVSERRPGSPRTTSRRPDEKLWAKISFTAAGVAFLPA